MDGDDTMYVSLLVPTRYLPGDQYGIAPAHKYAAFVYWSVVVHYEVHQFSQAVAILLQHLEEGLSRYTC